MTGNEKRIHEVKVRLTDSQMLAVSRLAHLDDRTLADYLNHIISIHLFGHEYRLPACSDARLSSVRGHE